MKKETRNIFFETLAVLPSVDGKEQFLVGGNATIWRYAAN
jgi:hypothetical protein